MRNLPRTAFVLLALVATPVAWAGTAGEFAPPQPPAGMGPAAHNVAGRTPHAEGNVAGPAPATRTEKSRPALVPDGSSFVFAPLKTAGPGPRRRHATGIVRPPVATPKTLPTRTAVKAAGIRRASLPHQPVLPAERPVRTRPAHLAGPGTHAWPAHPAIDRVERGRTAREHVPHPPLPRDVRLVSTRDYNLLMFPSPLRKAILPPDAPVAGKPLYLNGGRVLLLRFYPDGRRPVQLVAELQSGRVVTLSLVPDSHKAGAHITISAPVPATAPLHEYSTNPNARYVPTLARLVAGPLTCPKRLHDWDSVRRHGRRVPICWARRPEGFTPTALPRERIYNRLVARPVAAETYGNAVIAAYILHARDHKRSIVDPGQFSWVGVRAALLTGDRVDRYHSPVLYVVTSENH